MYTGWAGVGQDDGGAELMRLQCRLVGGSVLGGWIEVVCRAQEIDSSFGDFLRWTRQDHGLNNNTLWMLSPES